MQFEKRVTVDESREKVWAFITDLDSFCRCIPGCTSVVRRGDNDYLITVKDKIAFMQLEFAIEVSLADLQPPGRFEAICTGVDSKLTGSRFQMRNHVSLEAASQSQTTVTLKTEMSLFGKLGAIGAPVANMKANQIVTQLGENVKAALSPS